MPTYIKTLSFSTGSKFNPKKDDPKVNTALQQLQSQGAKISDVEVSLGGSILTGVVAVYLITYEVPNPIG
ncbi:MAG: hypothetical protein ACE5IE_01340 [Dehalococcoidia bacterium]